MVTKFKLVNVCVCVTTVYYTVEITIYNEFILKWWSF